MHKLYKAFWIVVIGGVIGYIVETIYCLLKNGVFESRQGLLYAPFSQIYGLGALLLVLATLPVKDKGNKWIFGVCAIGGGLFEFVCSWVQEYFLGVQSWDYPAFALSLAGRTSIIYMVFWGALGVFFTRCIYPKISIFIDRVLNSSGRFLTWIAASAMIFPYKLIHYEKGLIKCHSLSHILMILGTICHFYLLFITTYWVK